MRVLGFNPCSRLPVDRPEEPGVADAVFVMLLLGFFENDSCYPLPLAEAPRRPEDVGGVPSYLYQHGEKDPR